MASPDHAPLPEHVVIAIREIEKLEVRQPIPGGDEPRLHGLELSVGEGGGGHREKTSWSLAHKADSQGRLTLPWPIQKRQPMPALAPTWFWVSKVAPARKTIEPSPRARE